MRSVQLLSGQQMPLLGLGTWDLRGRQCGEVVGWALDMGYRHIDTAWMYENQREVGEGIRSSGLSYDEIFLTSKIWHTHLQRDQVLSQHTENLEQLGFDYVDLLLVHWPGSDTDMEETLDAFAQIQEEGRARAIGVSNFSSALVDEARQVSRVAISVNQIKYNLQNLEEALREHCQKNDIAVTAYTPLARGALTGHQALEAAAERHGKTAAQVALKWLVQKDVVVIPKASSREHLRENMDLFDWQLSDSEMAELDRGS